MEQTKQPNFKPVVKAERNFTHLQRQLEIQFETIKQRLL